MRSLFSLLPLLLIFASCSGKQASTKIKIENFGFSFTAGAGGAIVSGWSVEGAKFTRILTSDKITEVLPQGTWTFGIVSWDGSGGKLFTGETSCGFHKETLTQDEATIKITMSNANCFSTEYAASSANQLSLPNRFKTASVHFCEDNLGPMISTDDCLYDPAIAPLFRRSFVGSYKIAIMGGRSFGSAVSESLVSECYSASGNDEPGPPSTYSSLLLNIPTFLPSTDIPFKVVAYLGPACEEGMGKIESVFTDVLKVKTINVSSNSKKIFVRVPVAKLCETSNGLTVATEIASGEGNTLFPYLICNEKQLKAISLKMDDANYSGASYVQGADFDLLKFINAGVGSTPFHACTKDGDTFVPMGRKYDGFPSCNLLANTFTGQYDGNGFKISHFRFKSEMENNVGFLGIVGSSANVYNITLEQAEIEGSSNVGAIIGQFSGSGIVHNLRVKNSRIDGNLNTGGVIGSTTSTITTRVFGHNLRVRGNDKTGGLVGSTTLAGSVVYASFSGSIFSDNGGNQMGGIVGYGNDVQNAFSTGTLSSSGTGKGGILGYGQSASYTRSDMLIRDIGPGLNRYVGGILGEGTGSTTRSLYYGMIVSDCVSVSCKVGGLSGSGHSPAYAYSTFRPGLAGVDGSATYSLASVWTSSILDDSVSEGLCRADGSCQWTQLAGDLPRLDHETGAPCANTNDNLAFASQANTGTLAAPYAICNPIQMNTIYGPLLAKSFSVKQNINLQGLPMLGDFTGSIEGNNKTLFGFNASGISGPTALFSDISSTGKVKNLRIDGFQITGTACSGCLVAGLTLSNAGLIDSVSATDFTISLDDSTSFIGGLVGDNTGKIIRSNMRGTLVNGWNVGGIAYTNSGTIESAVSNVNIDGLDRGGAGAGYFGGIVAENYGVIQKSLFKGRIEHTTDSDIIGGIAGKIFDGSSLIDNEFGYHGEISIGSSTDKVGGIAGESDDSDAAVTRNVTNGKIVIPSTNSEVNIKGIVGSQTFTGVGNLILGEPLKEFNNNVAASATAVAYNAGTKVCRIRLDGTLVGTDSSGGVSLDNKLIRGHLTYVPTNQWHFDTIQENGSDCTALLNDYNAAGLRNLLRNVEGVTAYTIPNLRLPAIGYNIVDMTVATDRTRAFNAYKAFIRGEIPADIPVWSFEPDEEEGFRLFEHD